MNASGDKSIGTITGWLDGLSRRQQAISTNIANIDTPGYQAQEVSFEQTLQTVSSKYRLTVTDPKHIPVPSSRTALGVQGAEALTSSRIDNNNVSIDQEMVALADTQMKYSAAANALNMKVGILRDAIRG